MKRSTLIIPALLLLAFALRMWNLSAQSMWWDEAFTWQMTSHGFANFWQMLLTGDRNPPLYFVSVTLWGSVAGWSEFSLRFVSVAWSMVGLAFLFNLARRLYNTSAGLWTLALAAAAPALVVYAQEARMYAAFFALTAATLFFAWRVLETGNQHSEIRNRKLIWAFLVCEAGLLLTHYFAIPLVATLNLFALIVLLQRRSRFPTYAKWIGGQFLAALPIVIWTLIVFTTPGSLIKPLETPPDILSFFDQVIMLWLSGVRDLHGDWIALPCLTVLILPVVVIGAWLVNRRSTRWVMALVTASLGIAYAMTLALTSFHPRYALPYSVPLFVILGSALSNLSTLKPVERKRKRGVRGLVGIATALLMMFAVAAGGAAASAPSVAKDDARGVAAYLKQNGAAEDVILLEANDYTLNYYDHGLAQTKMITATTEPVAFQQLRDAIGSARRVWLPHWKMSTQDLRGYWPFLLEQSGALRDWTSYRGYELYRYDMQSILYEPVLKPAADTGMVTRWSGLEGQGIDGAVALALTWQTPVKFFDRARASVRLIDARGNTLSARDAALLDQRGRPTDQWGAIEPVTNTYVLPIPPGTSPGTYTITTQLYTARDVLAEEIVGTVNVPRYLATSDPYRTLTGYNWQTLANPQIVSGLMVDAYAVSPQMPWKPGPIDITLRWRKTGDMSDFMPRLRLAQADRIWSEIGSNLLEHDYPIGQWVEGETVIEHLKIDYPPVRGPLTLQIGQGDQWITLTTLQLDESQMMFTPPSMPHTQLAQFGDFAELLGYDLNSESLSSTHPLDLKLYWRATSTVPLTTPYTVFTQLLAPDGRLVAQDDAPPDPPTTEWVSGQIVADPHRIKVVDPAYRGPATLIVGWYNSASVERVPVSSGGDFVTLTVPVRVENQQ
jgi:4-amino-4-deoxy-L-arabinose transferase-like glycosyltransferase